MKYTVIVEKGKESGYVAFCPVLRGCVAQGHTEKAAIANLKKAMEDYIECLLEDGIQVPTEIGTKTMLLDVRAYEQAT